MAAEKGDARAMINLAQLYSNGTGVYKDMALFKEWATKAADQRNPYAIVRLYEEYGTGSQEDLEEAYKNLAIETKEDFTGLAYFRLARCYLLGFGTTKDEAKSLECYLKAAQLGHPGIHSDMKLIVLTCRQRCTI